MSSLNRSDKKVCFIGAPGAGKSTIYKALLENRYKGDLWAASSEAKTGIAKSLKFPGNNGLLKSAAASMLLRSGIAGRLDDLISEYILKKIIEENFRGQRAVYSTLFDAAWKGLENEIGDPVSRMSASAFFVKLAKEEMLIDKYYTKGTVIFDDSMWQSLRGVKKYFKNADGKLLSGLPIPGAVVYCMSAPDVVFSRIKAREMSGKLNTAHYGLTDRMLYRSVVTDIENARAKARLLKMAGASILEINCEDDLSSNTAAVRQFLMEL